MGYTPAFDSIYTGTLYGKWPTAAVWASLIPLIDARGEINLSPEAIAGMTGWPLELLLQGLEALCEPDPRSRSKAEDGRRLVLIDANRDWGWRVVNVSLYREKAAGLNQIADGRNAEKVRRYKERHRQTPEDTGGHRQTPGTPHSDSDTNASKSAPKARGSRLPEDFSPDLEYAKQQIPDIDPDGEAQRFRDYWKSRSGSAAVKTDWPAVWRNWIRNCRDSGKYARRKGQPSNGLPILNG